MTERNCVLCGQKLTDEQINNHALQCWEGSANAGMLQFYRDINRRISGIEPQDQGAMRRLWKQLDSTEGGIE